jgi:hypothetical protein
MDWDHISARIAYDATRPPPGEIRTTTYGVSREQRLWNVGLLQREFSFLMLFRQAAALSG